MFGELSSSVITSHCTSFLLSLLIWSIMSHLRPHYVLHTDVLYLLYTAPAMQSSLLVMALSYSTVSRSNTERVHFGPRALDTTTLRYSYEKVFSVDADTFSHGM